MRHRKPNGTAKLERAPDKSATPCFHFRACGNYSVCCKQGKTLCRPCADKLQGLEYPLPHHSPHDEPISVSRITRDLGMHDERMYPIK